MARLNDAPPSIESLEALKRRFTRQNRDLARTNSSQSLRIRNLETEISRLLSENISLREAAIASSEECERYRRRNALGEDILALKGRLQRRLEQVNALVEEMGGLQEKAERRERENGRRRSGMGTSEEMKSPNERDWRNRQTLAGLLYSEQDGRLPVIVEDKLYPRRTLEPLEIKNLVDDTGQDAKDSESPELGPPPVAHFDDAAEPIDFTKENEGSPDGVQAESDVLQLPNNLETRRKRRTSSLLRNMTDPAESGDENKPSLFKSGAKRKLDVSELEEIAAHAASGSENEEFVFQRRPTLKPGSSRKSSRFSMPNTLQGEIIIPNNAAVSPKKEKQEERKVLAPKSTNSPSKRAIAVDGKLDHKQSDATRRKDNSRHPDSTDISERPPSRRGPKPTNPTPKPSSLPPSEATSQTSDQPPSEIPPKTPFLPSDILSPVSSNPTSTSSHKPTAPSEAAILTSVEDVLNGSLGRASRRAKAAVSYAEPNLRDKMRRPGREMVGAVEGIDAKKRDGSIGGVLSRSTSEDVEARIKIEENEEAWRGLPMINKGKEKEEQGSPLSEKKGHPHLQRQSTTDDPGRLGGELERDRGAAIRRHAQARREQKALLACAAPTNAQPSALANRLTNPSTHREGPQQDLNAAVQKLSIFDGPNSSPVTLANGNAAGTAGGVTSTSMARKGQPPSAEACQGASTVKRRVPSSTISSSSSSTVNGNANARQSNAGAPGPAANRRHSLAPSSSSSSLLSVPQSTSTSTSNPQQKSITTIGSDMPPKKPPVNLSRSRSTAGPLSDKTMARDGVAGDTASGAGGLRRTVSVSGVRERPGQGQGHPQHQQSQSLALLQGQGQVDRDAGDGDDGVETLSVTSRDIIEKSEKTERTERTERMATRRRSMMI